MTCVIVPNDVQEMEMVESPERHHGTTFSGIGYREPRIVPRDEDLKKAANLLNSGQEVAVLVGAGALGAAREVAQLAELLGADVAKALLATVGNGVLYAFGKNIGNAIRYSVPRASGATDVFGSSRESRGSGIFMAEETRALVRLIQYPVK